MENKELNVYQCLLDLAEKEAGCHLPILEGRNSSLPECHDMLDIQTALAKQALWTDEDIAQNGCMVSCTQENYKVTGLSSIDYPEERLGKYYKPSE